ncbi:hypothetical protein HMPREF9073_02353 [Capnocytophaga sp. oral taxon 326 str. F0382]|nr:hypothetical protein HMPREF9073_02353 [Capnocytophaga sp. oral taxon 326 str. F0382]
MSVVPSKNGLHLITTPFNISGATFAGNIEVKKDYLTNLLIC